MIGERPQLYKIRRMVRAGQRTHFQWWAGNDEGWALDQIDGEAFTSIPAAQKVCEAFKVHNRDPNVIFHSVVPA